MSATDEESMGALDDAIVRLARNPTVTAVEIQRLAKAWDTLHGSAEEETKPLEGTTDIHMLESHFWEDGSRKVGFHPQPRS